MLCIISVWYIDSKTYKTEQYAQNNYSAFDTVTDEELQAEKKRVEELYKIQNNYTLIK